MIRDSRKLHILMPAVHPITIGGNRGTGERKFIQKCARQNLHRENQAESRENFLCEHLWENKKIPPSEGLRTEKWKYFRYRNDLAHEELYDLKKDSLEIHNLTGNHQYQDVLDVLRRETDSAILLFERQKLIN